MEKHVILYTCICDGKNMDMTRILFQSLLDAVFWVYEQNHRENYSFGIKAEVKTSFNSLNERAFPKP